MNEPTYVKCIEKPCRIGEQAETFCEKDVASAWVFQGLDHAVQNHYNDGRLLVCRECLKKAVDVFQEMQQLAEEE